MENKMKLTEFFLAQLDREAVHSRLALQRVPEGYNDWKPHDKSMPFGHLASLVATMPLWIVSMVNQNQFDMKSPEAENFKPLEWRTRAELLNALDRAVSAAHDALSQTTDEHLLTPWKLIVGGQIVSESPRYVMIADSVFSHLAHHRGQLTVYLRLKAASVPSLYGPSADEKSFPAHGHDAIKAVLATTPELEVSA